MEKNIIANQLSAKLITSQEVTVNGRDINEWLKEQISELELDPVFKNWLSADSRLSDIGQNEISDYAKVDLLEQYAKKSELSDYAEKSDLTAYAEKEELTAYAEKSELSDYALDQKVDDVKEELEQKIADIKLSGEYLPLSGGSLNDKASLTVSRKSLAKTNYIVLSGDAMVMNDSKNGSYSRMNQYGLIFKNPTDGAVAIQYDRIVNSIPNGSGGLKDLTYFLPNREEHNNGMLATEEWADQKFAVSSDLEQYAKKEEVPTDLSDLTGALSANSARIATTGTAQYYVNLGYPAYNSGMQIGYDTATAHYLTKLPQASGLNTSLLNAELSTRTAYNKMDIDVKGKIKVTNGTTTATFQLPIDRGATTENVATREWTNSQLSAIGDLEDRVGALEDYKDEYIDPKINQIDTDLTETRQQLGNVYFDNDEESTTNLFLVAHRDGEYGDAAGFAIRGYEDNVVRFSEYGFKIDSTDLNVHFPEYRGGYGYLVLDNQVMKRWCEFVDPESVELQFVGYEYPNAIIDIKLLTQRSIAIYPDAGEIQFEEQAQEFQLIIDLTEYEGNGNPMINFITNSGDFLLDLFDQYQGFDCFEAGNIYSVKVMRFPYVSTEGYDGELIEHYDDYKTMITVRKLIND